MNVFLSLPHIYIKFHGRIHLILEVTKKTKWLCVSHGEKTDEVVLDQSTKHIQSAKFHS